MRAADVPARTVEQKLAHLREAIREMGSVLVCYSGGVDSALVLAVATEQLGDSARALTAVSPSLAASEKDLAERTARQLGARHDFVASNELSRDGYRANGPDRCFHCKSELYDIARAKQREWRVAEIVNGTNTDDLGDHRPGIEAARDAGVRSPLVEAGLDKSDVREAARLLGMAVWDKPALACLSSRIPYGTSVTPERLAQIGGLEAELRTMGFRQVRVRWHDTVARIEVGVPELAAALDRRQDIVRAGKSHGFLYVALDLAGYRPGSLNDPLGKRPLKLVR